MNTERTTRFNAARRVVVKVGSNVLTADNGLNLSVIDTLSRQISRLIDTGRQVIFVSSGAMACGLRKLKLKTRPAEIPKRQAIAAVGQAGLIQEYETAFNRFDKQVAQILFTGEDLSNRLRFLNARNTFNALLSLNVIPIVNENDTVAVEEIKFGDNDTLSAIIALMLDADLLINLTDIDGVYTADPRVDPAAERIAEIHTITPEIERQAGGIPGSLGTGGMRTKIEAARKSTAAGIPMIIGPGNRADVLDALFAGEPIGTYFHPKPERLASRKSWIAFSSKPRGAVIIDAGAVDAVIKNGKSLLASGIIGVEGDFSVGAPVFLTSSKDECLGVGLVNYGARDIEKIMGLHSNEIQIRLGSKPYDEVIHRDNLTITAEHQPETP
ncbi:MAG: glutamate 5-kinase [Deltaproteobacteria bacterium]|nr:MAG: glutamate 5-kinase [Deltaproteobacteria bacterium]